MNYLSTIFTNIEHGTPGLTEGIFCIGCVILVAVICYLLPDTTKRINSKSI